ncbi:MAG: hypothetical protein PVG13_07575 [Thiohalophilus sp.]
MSRHKPGLVHLLMLALLVMPWQSLYAQTQMQTSIQPDKCQHEKMQPMDSDHQAMTCCDQDSNHCDQSCRDCFHCQTLNAVAMDLNLEFDSQYSQYYLPHLPIYSGLPPASQYRPPRIHV